MYLAVNISHLPGFRFAINTDPVMFTLYSANASSKGWRIPLPAPTPSAEPGAVSGHPIGGSSRWSGVRQAPYIPLLSVVPVSEYAPQHLLLVTVLNDTIYWAPIDLPACTFAACTAPDLSNLMYHRTSGITPRGLASLTTVIAGTSAAFPYMVLLSGVGGQFVTYAYSPATRADENAISNWTQLAHGYLIPNRVPTPASETLLSVTALLELPLSSASAAGSGVQELIIVHFFTISDGTCTGFQLYSYNTSVDHAYRHAGSASPGTR